MNYLLLLSCFAALGLFCFTRPSWKTIGPSLLDSYVIGLSLFAIGSILVWNEGIEHSEAVMRIAVSTALFGMLGASLWSRLLASRIAGLNFFADAKRLVADPIESLTISAGFLVCSVVSLVLLVAVFSHEHVRSLLLDAFLRGADTLNEARIIVSSGDEGYFAPGYVKQFRDVIVPILCTAAILCGGTYRHRALVFAGLLIAIATTFVSGQRLVIVQYILCLGTAFLIERFAPRRKFLSLPLTLSLLFILIAAVGAMTKMLGRLDIPVSLRQQMLDLAQKRQTGRIMVASGGGLDDIGSLLSEISKPLGYANLPAIVAAPLSLAYRAVIAVPRENTISYPLWGGPEHAPGAGWLTDLASIRPGVQKQLSNELSWVNKGSRMGNSPLGLAPDIFHNWGWPGVMIVPALFALFFLWFDIALTASKTSLTSAAKIFMFFSIPLMYSPFMFVLYGGFVAVGILCYAKLRQKGAFSFLEMRLQTRQSPH